MNQILNTKFNKNNINKNKFIFLFISSVILIIFTFGINYFYKMQFEKEKNISTKFLSNYHVYQLFASSERQKIFYKSDDILGSISIPKLNISYPFFYGISEDLLKISPCRFSRRNAK